MKYNFFKLNNTFLISFIFIIGVFFIVKSVQYERKCFIEGMENKSKSSKKTTNKKNKSGEQKTKFSDKCPNVLVNEGDKIYLYNDQKAKIPGVNPIVFNNLEEYVEYIEFARSQGVQCPLLYLRKMNNTQGDDVYAIRSSPFTSNSAPQQQSVIEMTRGKNHLVDASRDDPPYNQNSFPGFDGENQRIGKLTPLNTYEVTHTKD